jgi:hypothetical protein
VTFRESEVALGSPIPRQSPAGIFFDYLKFDANCTQSKLHRLKGVTPLPCVGPGPQFDMDSNHLCGREFFRLAHPNDYFDRLVLFASKDEFPGRDDLTDAFELHLGL